MKNPTGILAIDGGGTRCRVACRLAGRLELAVTGSANVSTDLETALTNVTEGLRRVAEGHGMPLEMLLDLPAHVGLAGVVSDELADAVARRLPLSRVRVTDDRPAAVRGALGSEDGALAHCGTGSFFAVQRSRGIRLAGGWGAVLGDQASAQWVGKKALLATLDTADGLRPESPLTRQIASRFATSAGIVDFAAHASASDFGDLAPLVSAAAAEGDPNARAIFSTGATHIFGTLSAMDRTPDLPLCLTGGIGPAYAPYLPPAMANALRDKLGEPIDGALSLAEDYSRDLSVTKSQ